MLDTPKDFGRRLSAALAMRGWLIGEAADRFGISITTMSRMCNGKAKPSKTAALLMQEKLGPRTWEFLTGQSEALPNANGNPV